MMPKPGVLETNLDGDIWTTRYASREFAANGIRQNLVKYGNKVRDEHANDDGSYTVSYDINLDQSSWSYERYLLDGATLIELQPADVLVVEIDRVIDNVNAERIREVIGLHTGRRVLVIDGGRLRVLRETQLAACLPGCDYAGTDHGFCVTAITDADQAARR